MIQTLTQPSPYSCWHTPLNYATRTHKPPPPCFCSTQPVSPSLTHPESQSVHRNDPGVFKQNRLLWHPPLLVLHSSTSAYTTLANERPSTLRCDRSPLCRSICKHGFATILFNTHRYSPWLHYWSIHCRSYRMFGHQVCWSMCACCRIHHCCCRTRSHLHTHTRQLAYRQARWVISKPCTPREMELLRYKLRHTFASRVPIVCPARSTVTACSATRRLNACALAVASTVVALALVHV